MCNLYYNTHPLSLSPIRHFLLPSSICTCDSRCATFRHGQPPMRGQVGTIPSLSRPFSYLLALSPSHSAENTRKNTSKLRRKKTKHHGSVEHSASPYFLLGSRSDIASSVQNSYRRLRPWQGLVVTSKGIAHRQGAGSRSSSGHEACRSRWLQAAVDSDADRCSCCR